MIKGDCSLQDLDQIDFAEIRYGIHVLEVIFYTRFNEVYLFKIAEKNI